MKYSIFILTIKRNTTRIKNLLHELIVKNKIDKNLIKIFYGVDGKKITKNEFNILTTNSYWKYFIPLGVVGCAGSHILLWHNIQKEKDIDYFIILEDDTALNFDLFNKYRQKIEDKLNEDKNILINLGNSFKYCESNNNEYFKKCDIILSMNSYILTPYIANIMSNYYKIHKITYHIDFHLAFILNQLNIKLLSFKKRISYSLDNHYKSSMLSTHDKKFFLKYINDKELYKELLTPIIKINSLEINGYFCFLILFGIIFFLISNLSKKSYILCFIWFLYGLLFWDFF